MEEYSSYLIAKGYSKSTSAGLVKAAELYEEWLKQNNTPIETISYNDITAYIQYRQQQPIKSNTLQHTLTKVKHYLNYLVEAGTITHNPALALKLKNSKRKTVYNILSVEELEMIYKTYQIEPKKNLIAPPQDINILARKRNKILLGLAIYQGATAEDLANIELTHLELREGNIKIPGTRRSNERTLKLQSHQVFDLFEYVNETRKAILQQSQRQSTKLLVNTGGGSGMQNTIQKLFKSIKLKNPQVINLDQIRASVISHWLKNYNKRKVQYMAGHRYISSTERYEASNIEALQEDMEKYYPTF